MIGEPEFLFDVPVSPEFATIENYLRDTCGSHDIPGFRLVLRPCELGQCEESPWVSKGALRMSCYKL